MKFERLERQPLEPLDERLLVPGRNHVLPVGEALGQLALVEEQVRFARWVGDVAVLINGNPCSSP